MAEKLRHDLNLFHLTHGCRSPTSISKTVFQRI